MSQIAQQQTHNDSSRRNTESADQRPKTKTQRHNIPSARDRRENLPLIPISLPVAAKEPASVANEASHGDEEERRRGQPGEEALAAGALLTFNSFIGRRHVPRPRPPRAFCGKGRTGGVLDGTYHEQLDPVYQVLHVRDHDSVPSGEVWFLRVSDGVAVQGGGHGVAFDDTKGFPQFWP